ncbi:isoleucine--tRNA ligase [bacterium]|nr:isoleucine--tRNA ligase [bacterium]
MYYRRLDKNFGQISLEEEILSRWDKEQTFKKSLELAKDRPRFNFYEGPPTANGKPGVHHVISRTVKDIVCRYKSMTGYYVERKAGWDTHGLPVEIGVEKELGLKSKRDVLTYGVEKFNKACRDSVFRYLKDWEWMTRRIGYWLDLENAYITYDPKYIESIWYLLAQFFKKGYIYKGYKVLPYCARCGTGLSDHEVALGYRDTEDPSVYVLMKLTSPLPGEDTVPENTYFLVWTTTPWTLLSNVALAVHPDYEYLLVEHEGKNLVIVSERADAVLGEGNYKIIRKFKGTELARLRYEPLFRFVQPDKDAWFVINAEYVTTEDGTGIVHIAPAFGKEDFEEGQKWNLPLIQLVDDEGKIKPEAEPFAGLWFKDADPKIMDNLKSRGLLFRRETVVHSYPFCWRCDSPLLQYARSSWYIKTTAYKDRMIEENQKIKWYPPQIGAGRFGEWLKNNIDWAISRERFWGTPLNIWICEKCGYQHAVESYEELEKMSGQKLPPDFDPHKPAVDEIKLVCPKCGGTMTRTPEVLDCWFDSGGMPFAQYHYPFGISEEEFSRRFPADFIAEGVDQTRGWFYTLLAISTFIKGTSPYKTCVSIELVLDKNGQKMSKSRGNVVDPVEVINKYGADPLRWYFITTSPPWLPTRFDTDGVAETSRKFFDTLKNTYNFFALYAEIDGYTPEWLPEKLDNILDRWLVSRLNTLIKKYREWMEDYQMTRAAREIQKFVIDELSNWYVRRNRRRFWSSGMDEDKRNAYSVLWNTLVAVAELIAPFAPMTADFYWRALTEPVREQMGESAHFRSIPEVNEALIDADLEEQMALAIRVVELGRSARNTARINIRQPLGKIVVILPGEHHLPEEILSVVLDELNIKSLEFAEDAGEFIEYHAKPNFKVLGKRFGSLMPQVKAAIEALSSEDLARGLETGIWHITVDGRDHALNEEELLVEAKAREPYVVAAEKNIAVALDTTITPELRDEGFAREAVNRIQNTRKAAGLEVTDRIVLSLVSDDGELVAALKKYVDRIAAETLAKQVLFEPLEDAQFAKEWEIGKKKLVVSLKKA